MKDINNEYSFFYNYIMRIIFKYFTPLWIKPSDIVNINTN